MGAEARAHVKCGAWLTVDGLTFYSEPRIQNLLNRELDATRSQIPDRVNHSYQQAVPALG